MKLRFRTNRHLKIEHCLLIYKHLRQERAGHFIKNNLSEKTALNITDAADDCKISLYHFIKCQFDSMPPRFCKKIWKTDYPPFNVLCGRKCAERVAEFIWENRDINYYVTSIRDVLNHDVKTADTMNTETRMMALTSRLLSKYWVAYRRLLGDDNYEMYERCLPEKLRNEDIRMAFTYWKEN